MDGILFSDRPTCWRSWLCGAGWCSAHKGQLQNPQLWLPGSTGSSFFLPLGKYSSWRFKGLGAASKDSFQNSKDRTWSPLFLERKVCQLSIKWTSARVAWWYLAQIAPISKKSKLFLSAYRVGCFNDSDGSLLESMVGSDEYLKSTQLEVTITIDPLGLVGELGGKQ